MTLDSIAVTQHVLAEYQLDTHGIHGPAHWLRVRANGLALARLTPDADRTVIEAFALPHDSRRNDDWADIGHGERAGEFAIELHGRVSDHPTVGCRWDADRLDLSRLDRPPKDEFLSTLAAGDAAIQRKAWRHGASWRIDETGAARWGIDVALLSP